MKFIKNKLVSFALLFVLSTGSAPAANVCTPQNMAGTWNFFAQSSSSVDDCGEMTFELLIQLNIFSIKGQVSGYGAEISRMTFTGKCPGDRSTNEVRNIDFSNGQVSVNLASGKTWREPCSMNDDSSVMSLGAMDYKRTGSAQEKTSE